MGQTPLRNELQKGKTNQEKNTNEKKERRKDSEESRNRVIRRYPPEMVLRAVKDATQEENQRRNTRERVSIPEIMTCEFGASEMTAPCGCRCNLLNSTDEYPHFTMFRYNLFADCGFIQEVMQVKTKLMQDECSISE